MHFDLLGDPGSGGNCYLLATDTDGLLLDAGLAWSQDRITGVDFSVPRLSGGQARRIATIVITHPHEDHIGGLPYLLRQLPSVPHVVCGPVTAAVIEQRLDETHDAAYIEAVSPYSWMHTRDFRYQLIPVPHSASESMALYIECKGKRFLYSGDLRGTDETGYGRLPAEVLTRHANLDFLMLEAVRADVEDVDPTLADLKEGLLAALRRLEGRRIIVSCFASNITRVQIIIELARAVGRHVYLLGRSMHRAVELAQQFHRMPEEAWSIGPPPTNVPDESVLLLVPGAQGEPDAGLSRLIRGHYPVQARRGDGLIMSSTPIPGNEEPFWSLIELAMRKGIETITYRDYLVHLSGHSTATELQRIMRLVKPHWVIPFHGDYYRHAMMRKLGEKVGLAPRQFVRASNGDRISLDDPPRVEHCGWLVDYYQLGSGRQRRATKLDEAVLEERQRLLNAGTIMVRPGPRGPRITCLDCIPEVEEYLAQQPTRNNRDIKRLRQHLEEHFACPPMMVEVA